MSLFREPLETAVLRREDSEGRTQKEGPFCTLTTFLWGFTKGRTHSAFAANQHVPIIWMGVQTSHLAINMGLVTHVSKFDTDSMDQASLCYGALWGKITPFDSVCLHKWPVHMVQAITYYIRQWRDAKTAHSMNQRIYEGEQPSENFPNSRTSLRSGSCAFPR